MMAKEIWDKIEQVYPDQKRFDAGCTFESMDALASIAVSLKRIADVMARTNDHGEQGAASIGRSIHDALRGVYE